jgi:hypothetical protein
VGRPTKQRESTEQGDCVANPLYLATDGKRMVAEELQSLLVSLAFLGALSKATQKRFLSWSPLYLLGPYSYFAWPLLLIHCGWRGGTHASSVRERLLQV